MNLGWEHFSEFAHTSVEVASCHHHPSLKICKDEYYLILACSRYKPNLGSFLFVNKPTIRSLIVINKQMWKYTNRKAVNIEIVTGNEK